MEITDNKILTQQKYINEAEKQTQSLIENFENQIDDNNAHITTYEKQKNELYLQVDEKNKKVKFVRVPKFEEVPYPIVMEPNLVIEYYSR